MHANKHIYINQAGWYDNSLAVTWQVYARLWPLIHLHSIIVVSLYLKYDTFILQVIKTTPKVNDKTELWSLILRDKSISSPLSLYMCMLLMQEKSD